MEPHNLLVSSYCAALYDEEWNRAVVTHVTSPTTCRLFYIDYGSILDVSFQHVRFVQFVFSNATELALAAVQFGAFHKRLELAVLLLQKKVNISKTP